LIGTKPTLYTNQGKEGLCSPALSAFYRSEQHPQHTRQQHKQSPLQPLQSSIICVIDDLRKKLKHTKTYWVKVSIPLEVLEEREVAWGMSPKGHARSHYASLYWNIPYDLEVHSDQESATEIAKKIAALI
jgi:hypothetical protein